MKFVAAPFVQDDGLLPTATRKLPVFVDQMLNFPTTKSLVIH
ncbi:MAG: hypothetical protein AAF519_15175 [Bacteroidota bacterium]